MRNQEPVAVAIEVASKATLPFLPAINQIEDLLTHGTLIEQVYGHSA
jgi:hypothetical protein